MNARWHPRISGEAYWETFRVSPGEPGGQDLGKESAARQEERWAVAVGPAPAPVSVARWWGQLSGEIESLESHSVPADGFQDDGEYGCFAWLASLPFFGKEAGMFRCPSHGDPLSLSRPMLDASATESGGGSAIAEGNVRSFTRSLSFVRAVPRIPPRCTQPLKGEPS